MGEQNTVPQNADRAPSEGAGAQAVSFIVRIWRQRADPNCRGWVEHVQSGERTAFLGLDRLCAIIAAHLGLPTGRAGVWRNGLKRGWACLMGRYGGKSEMKKQG